MRWYRYKDPLGQAPPKPEGPIYVDPGPQARQMSEAEIAWVAGLLEGEGCFFLTIRKNKDGTPRPLLSVICSMTDEDVIRKLHATIGSGGVSTKLPKNPKCSQAWTWCDSNVERVVPLIRTLQPHMGERRGAKIDDMLAAAQGWERRYVRTHGTPTMYQGKGCRCALCRGANAALARRQRERRKEADQEASRS